MPCGTRFGALRGVAEILEVLVVRADSEPGGPRDCAQLRLFPQIRD